MSNRCRTPSKQRITGSAPPTTDSRPNESVMFGIVELVALVDRLQAENRDLAASAAIWQERARVLTDQLALAAPQQPQDDGPAVSGATEGPDPSGEPELLPPTPNER